MAGGCTGCAQFTPAVIAEIMYSSRAPAAAAVQHGDVSYQDRSTVLPSTPCLSVPWRSISHTTRSSLTDQTYIVQVLFGVCV